uniref:Methylenetetrahydrofolate reductase (NAD(P)H) n=1 Tax=Rhodosorus marinus TaxID=101924 RepID=A0A7S3EE24_9RHOD|mmetsp:Transcript_28507/g.111662  ORF Transcript_28507/g.111662 Transcript_28507/m.111662 type:complete len:298 (+) Transcript_28507:140-1033(+)
MVVAFSPAAVLIPRRLGRALLQRACSSSTTDSMRVSVELTPKMIRKAGEKVRQLLPEGMPVFIPHLAGEPYSEVINATVAVANMGMNPVPHIASRRFRTIEEAGNALHDLTRRISVKQALLISGDHQVTPSNSSSMNPSSTEFVSSMLMQKNGFQGVFMSAFPQPRHGNLEEYELEALRKKVKVCEDSGLHLKLVTQFCCDDVDLERWLKRNSGVFVREEDLHVGVVGPVKVERLRWFAKELGLSEKGIVAEDASKTSPDQQVNLVKASAPRSGLHIFPFGGLSATSDWLQTHLELL